MGTKKRKKEENETCVMCGARTNYSSQDPIEYRYGSVSYTHLTLPTKA